MLARPMLLLAVVVAVSAMSGLAAQASPLCVKERTPFALSDDTVKWTMSIAPGADCIQGLRWSDMQIFNVSVVSGPSRGQLAVVGSGFRYSAENHPSEPGQVYAADLRQEPARPGNVDPGGRSQPAIEHA